MAPAVALHALSPRVYEAPSLKDVFDRLSKMPGFRMRPEQFQLAQAVYESFMEQRPLCAEAPTGTGKTLAYLLGALVAVKHIHQQNPVLPQIPIVISTNTVALQDQIATKEVLTLVELGLVEISEVVVAKGRDRHFCPRMAQRTARVPIRPVFQQADLFGVNDSDVQSPTHTPQQEAKGMLDAWSSGQWAGMIDDWSGQKPKSWPQIRVSKESCTQHQCWAYAAHCPFFNSRRQMGQAKIVIANHNLVLADLGLRENDATPVLPFAEYALVFDEGHNLPEKAIQYAETAAGVVGPQDISANLAALAEEIAGHEMIRFMTQREDWYSVLTGRKMNAALRKLYREAERIAEPGCVWVRVETDTEGATEALRDIKKAGFNILNVLRDLRGVARTLIQSGNTDLDGVNGELGLYISRLEGLLNAFSAYADESTPVRWVEYRWHEGLLKECYFKTSPLEGAEVLESLLWKNFPRVAVVSATLQALGDFSHFKQQSGLPDCARLEVLPHVFPYQKSKIHLPAFPVSPKDPEYGRWVARWLNKFVNRQEGTLVLFTSRQSMDVVVAHLAEDLKCIALIQSGSGNSALIERHRECIDAGRGSLLIGLSTMAEGLDLHGKYCTHLVLTRLFFAVPATPLEEARFEASGNKDAYFQQYCVPSATRKLIQAVGRLIRRETDRGKVTVLDRRLRGSAWGKAMLESLPPFSRSFSHTENSR